MSKLLNLVLSISILLSLISPSALIAAPSAEAAPVSTGGDIQLHQPNSSAGSGTSSITDQIEQSLSPEYISEAPILSEGQDNIFSREGVNNAEATPAPEPPSYPQPPTRVVKEEKKVEKQSTPTVRLDAYPAKREMTLITGDKVVVNLDAQGKSTGYAIKLADPGNPGQSYSIMKIQGDTYVIPRGINLKLFDRELFNVDRLLRDDYDKEKEFPVLVSSKSSLPVTSSKALYAGLQSFSSSTRELKSSPTIASRLNLSTLPSVYKSLSTDSRVEKVWLDKKVKMDLTQSVPQIEAPVLWSAGITGAGQKIAMLDTGIDVTHPGLSSLLSSPGPKVIQQVNFSDDLDVMDHQGHGTHTAGIAAGTGGGAPYLLPTSPSHAWWSGTGNNLDTTLQRSVNLASLATAALNFNTYYNLETNFDHGDVKISTTGTAPWTTLATYSGNSGSFGPRSINLNAYAGSTVTLRFEMTTDSINYYDGWYLDDIAVTGVFSDNVESGPGIWATSGWSIIQALPHSGNMVWYSGSANNLDNYLTRSFNFSGLASASLNFLTRYSLESNWDYGYVQVSSTGTTWNTLDTFNGNSGMGFQNKNYNLNAYVGNPDVRIRFYYHTDPSTSWEGWYIDDISIPQIPFSDNAEAGNMGWTIINSNAPSPSWGIIGLNYRGVAPDAWLWNVKVMNQFGWGFDSWIINGIDYARLGPDGLPHTGDEAQVISMSLGGGPGDGSDPMSIAVDKAVDDGLVVVIAAGNSGSGYYTTDSPGVARKPITVGAVDKTDILASFSSRGPTLDFRVKPDVLAPGVSITSSIPGGGYAAKSGTSMATPHVAGAAALLLQASTIGPPKPSGYDNNRYVKDTLINTAKDLGLNVYNQGGGRIDAATAAYSPIIIDEANKSLGRITGPVSVSYTITNRATSSMTLNFTGQVNEMISGADYSSIAWFTPTSLTIPGLGAASMTMTVNAAGLPHDFVFSGKIAASSSGKIWRAIYGFHTLEAVTLRKIPRDAGGSVQGDGFVIFRDSSSSFFQYGSFDPMGYATVYLTAGAYQVFSDGMTEAFPSSYVAVIMQNQVITSDTTITLDEGSAVPITLNPNKAGQKLAELFNYVKYNGTYVAASFGDLLYYPTATWTFYQSTTTWQSWSDYAYYASSSFIAADPGLVNAPEWHRLLFTRPTTTASTIYNVDYTQLAKRNTKYAVPNTPDARASRMDFVFDPMALSDWTFVWDMNAPQIRTEWLSPASAYYTWGGYWSPPDNPMPVATWEWDTWISQQYASGAGTAAALNYDIGSMPSRPGFTDFIVSTGYWQIDGTLMADRNRNNFWSSIHPGGMSPGHIDVFKDGAPDGSSDTGDYGYYLYRYFGGPPWPLYTVKVTATSPLLLSTTTQTIWNFHTDPAGDMIPPSLQLTSNWDGAPTGADDRNRVPSGNVTMRLNVTDSSLLSVTTPPWVKWSVNDGSTWNDAALSYIAASAAYEFTIPGLASGAYLSLWTRATDNAVNSTEYKVIHALAVKSGAPAADTTPPPAPGLLLPPDGSTAPTAMPTFTWNSVNDDLTPPVLYDLQVATNSAMSSAFINQTNIAVNSYTLTGGQSLAPGFWYWRIRSRDSVSPTPNYSAWVSPPFSFAISGLSWTVTVTAAFDDDSATHKKDFVAAYASTTATTGSSDTDDVPDPPDPPSNPFMDLQFNTGANALQRDARPLTGTPLSVTWDLRAKVSSDVLGSANAGPPAAVTVTWDVSLVPSNLVVILDDTANGGSLVNLRASPFYVYNTSSIGTFRALKLIAQQDSPPTAAVTFPSDGGTVVGTINVTANISDPDVLLGDRVTTVNFSFASAPWAVWNPIGLGTQTSTGVWSASWNTFLIPEATNYKVMVSAQDMFGGAGSDTSDNPFSVIHQITGTNTWKTGWNMWSYPFAPNPTTNSGQLSDNIPAGLFVFHYNPTTGVYDLTDTASTGWGYWTKVNGNTFIDMVGFPVTTPTYVLSTGNNWNQIGNPYNATVTWSNVQARVGGLTRSITDAQAVGWMSQYIYDYDPVLGVYNFNGTATGKLVPGAAYWTRINVPGLDLLIPKP